MPRPRKLRIHSVFPAFMLSSSPKLAIISVSLFVISTTLSHNFPGESCEMNRAKSSTQLTSGHETVSGLPGLPKKRTSHWLPSNRRRFLPAFVQLRQYERHSQIEDYVCQRITWPRAFRKTRYISHTIHRNPAAMMTIDQHTNEVIPAELMTLHRSVFRRLSQDIWEQIRNFSPAPC